uniref:Uncharacterized protein n=1 Tax=Romanomermis culicivorax TaxID=13658 RepID=A0A915JBY0_ROMCU
MFWPSSGRQAGYGKGDYSPALPLGVGCFGLIFLALGLMASLGLPALLMDSIRNNVCILHKENANFPSWLMHSYCILVNSSKVLYRLGAAEL